jgi:adenylosuccinate lyase
MGTAQDMLDLFGGDAAKLAELERRVAEFLGFTDLFSSVGQVYPRSLDHDVVSALVQLGAGPSSFAHTIRLMAGHELVTEGFAPGQVGSSAMPHKMNTRSCERVNGLQVVLRGYASMAAELAGAQWNEGDVFCSVVRRVALPDAFFAIDGQIETFLTVLDEFGAYPAVIQRELDRYLPFLATTRILMAAVRVRVGREAAHEVIKEHAVAVALAMREKGQEPDLLDRLAADPGCRWTASSWTRRWPTRRRSPGRPVIRSTPWSPRSRTGGPLPRSRQVHLGCHLVTLADLTDLDNFAHGFPHELFAAHRREAPVCWHPPHRANPRRRGLLVGRDPCGNPCSAA